MKNAGDEVRLDKYLGNISHSTGILDLATRPRAEQDDWARTRTW